MLNHQQAKVGIQTSILKKNLHVQLSCHAAGLVPASKVEGNNGGEFDNSVVNPITSHAHKNISIYTLFKISQNMSILQIIG